MGVLIAIVCQRKFQLNLISGCPSVGNLIGQLIPVIKFCSLAKYHPNQEMIKATKLSFTTFAHPQITRNCFKTHPEDCVFVAPFCAIRPHSAFARVQWHNSPRLQRGFVDMQTYQMSKMVSKNTIRDVGSTALYTAYTVDTVYNIQNAKYWMDWTGKVDTPIYCYDY